MHPETSAGASVIGQEYPSAWRGIGQNSFGSAGKRVRDETASHGVCIPAMYVNKPLSEEFINE